MRTSDGVIPWRLFVVLISDLHHVLALRRLNEAQAISHALMVVMGEESSGRVRAEIDELVDDAFPMVEER